MSNIKGPYTKPYKKEVIVINNCKVCRFFKSPVEDWSVGMCSMLNQLKYPFDYCGKFKMDDK